jgi:hypothetical protein
MRAVLPLLVLATVLGLAGCGGASVPKAPIGLGVPYGYRATHVWRANLSGQSVPDVVVASAGPPVTSFGFHSADIRVLVWDPLAHQWSVAFDAQRVRPSEFTLNDPGGSNWSPGLGFVGPVTMPLIDPKANVSLGPVRFVRLLAGTQLAFEASMDYGGSGVPQVLAVVDFKDGLANVVYSWNGEGLEGWHVAKHALHARAEYWTPTDAHCCALGRYAFVVAERKYGVEEIRDSRPWLGVVVRELNDADGLAGTLRVVGFTDTAPAKGRLRTGDLIVNVLDAPKLPKDRGVALDSIFDKIILLHPGATVRLLVERDGKRIVVPVTLGSMRDSLGTFLPKTDNTYAAL